MKNWLAIGLGWAIALGATIAAAQPPALDRTKVEAFVDGAVRQAMRSDHIAGVSVAIVDRSGVVLTRGYGLASISPRRAADADTLFRVGSISKTAVWISLMQLVQDGRIRLDDPINDHLPPDLRIPDEGFARPIRVQDLMSHSAGFEDSILQGFIIHDPERLDPLGTFLRTHRLHRVREAGSLSTYSNYGASLAGAIVEHVSGQGWPDYAEQHVFRPLGMPSATYRQPYSTAIAVARGLPAPMPPMIAAKLADSMRFSSGEFQPQAFEYINGGIPAGALSASANDMAQYMRALLDPARMQAAGVLSADTAMAMRLPLSGNSPELGRWRHGFMDQSSTLGRPIFGHDGDLIYQHAVMDIYPGAGVAIFVAVNNPGGLPLLDALPIGFFDAFVGPQPPPPPRAPDAKAEAAQVAGTYWSMRRPAFRSERAFMRLLGMREVEAEPNGDILVGGGDRYYPIGHGTFARTDGPGRIAFGRSGGKMLMFDDVSANPAERIGYLKSAKWLGLIGLLAAFIATWGVACIVPRLFRRDEPGRASTLVLDGLCLIWLAAFALVAAATSPWMSDAGSVLFTYPGKLLPAALWALLIAAFATPLAAVVIFGPLRPHRWSWWRWTKHIAALAIFAALAVTLFNWGFLGFSGW